MAKPKVVQVVREAASGHGAAFTLVLMDDGSMWDKYDGANTKWERFPGPFGDAPETESVKLAAVVEFIQHSAQRLNRTNNPQKAVSDAAARMAAAAEMLRQIAEGGGE